MSVNENFIYSLFSNVYYERELPQYDYNEIGTSEAVQCLLKSFFQRKLARKLFDPKIVILSFGRIVHLALQEKLEEHGYNVEVEKPIELDTITLYTHTDALHDTHTLEIKTITSMPTSILPQHFHQANTYTVAHKKPVGYITYIHKPSGIVKVFPYKPIAESFNYICLRAFRLSHAIRHNTTPEPEPSWLCRYCEYIDICPRPQRYTPRKGGF